MDANEIGLEKLVYKGTYMKYREREAGEGDIGASSSPYALTAYKGILTLR